MKTNYITKSHIWSIAGIGSTISWTSAFVLALIFNHDSFVEEVLPICLICIPLIVISILITMMSLLWYIKVDDEEVVFRNMFGITKTYKNSELNLVMKHHDRKGAMKFYIYKGEKKITTITQFDTNLPLISKFKNTSVEELKKK